MSAGDQTAPTSKAHLFRWHRCIFAILARAGVSPGRHMQQSLSGLLAINFQRRHSDGAMPRPVDRLPGGRSSNYWVLVSNVVW